MAFVACCFALIVVCGVVALIRERLLEPATIPRTMPITAASITTIEAAFLRAGPAGVAALRRAADESGTPLADPRDDAELARDLAARGFTVDARTQRNLQQLRRVGWLASTLIAVLTLTAARLMTAMPGAGPTSESITVALIWASAVAFIASATQRRTATRLGSSALAMRQAAYPLELLRDVDPVATVGLYGGTLRRRRTGGSGGDELCWEGGADGASGSSAGHGHDGSGGHGAHGCASTCGSGGCGGH